MYRTPRGYYYAEKNGRKIRISQREYETIQYGGAICGKYDNYPTKCNEQMECTYNKFLNICTQKDPWLEKTAEFPKEIHDRIDVYAGRQDNVNTRYQVALELEKALDKMYSHSREGNENMRVYFLNMARPLARRLNRSIDADDHRSAAIVANRMQRFVEEQTDRYLTSAIQYATGGNEHMMEYFLGKVKNLGPEDEARVRSLLTSENIRLFKLNEQRKFQELAEKDAEQGNVSMVKYYISKMEKVGPVDPSLKKKLLQVAEELIIKRNWKCPLGRHWKWYLRAILK